MWQKVALYSPAAFGDRRLEEQYRAFRSAHIGRDVPVILSMTVLFWSVSLLRGMSGPPQPWAFAAAGFSLLITACTLLVHTSYAAAYSVYWPVLHVLVHMAHIPTLVAVHRILIGLYSPPYQLTCTNSFNCAHEHMLIFPHFASGDHGMHRYPPPLDPPDCHTDCGGTCVAARQWMDVHCSACVIPGCARPSGCGAVVHLLAHARPHGTLLCAVHGAPCVLGGSGRRFGCHGDPGTGVCFPIPILGSRPWRCAPGLVYCPLQLAPLHHVGAGGFDCRPACGERTGISICVRLCVGYLLGIKSLGCHRSGLWYQLTPLLCAPYRGPAGMVRIVVLAPGFR
jgi:hypothetical protein